MAPNVELLRTWIEAYNARNMEAFVGSCDPGVELYSLFAAVGGVTLYRGHDGVRRWWREFEESWDRPRIEPEAFFDLGGRRSSSLCCTDAGGKAKSRSKCRTRP